MIKAPLLCYTPCLIARGFFGLVAVLAFLIDNDYTDVVERREYCTSCTYNYLCLSLFNALVLIGSLTEGQVAVDNRYIASEQVGEVPHHLRGE